jgi:hypothetical protein
VPRALLRAEQIDRDLGRMGKYALAYKFLTDRLTEEEYRRLMEEVPVSDASPKAKRR